MYLNAANEKLYFYGKINQNTVSGRGAGIVLSNNGKDNYAEMYEGAEIIGNEVAKNGGGIMVSCGAFTMMGGRISENTAHNAETNPIPLAAGSPLRRVIITAGFRAFN